MPTLALIADIHANLPALEAVLSDIDANPDVEAIFHLGDLVGYAPWPNETVALLRSRDIRGVAGNYDSTVAHRHAHCGCHYEDPLELELSHKSFAWTLAAVNDETRAYLASLPFRLDLRPTGGHRRGPVVCLVHGTPMLNTVYWQEDRSDEFCLKMAKRAGLRSGDTIVFGHTHLPWQRRLEGILFVNAGSVGRPKDRDARAGYVLITIGDTQVVAQSQRVQYDVEKATSGILESGLPHDLAQALRRGGAPAGA